MRILITGSSGQLGNELQRCLFEMKAEISAISSEYKDSEVDAVDADALDITNEKVVSEWFNQRDPYDIVINCAVMTNVDGCETAEDKAILVNG
jgi:dTDP-4-dehydrorhamnose reductase